MHVQEHVSPKKRRYVVISDVHLGCRTTPAEFILNNLQVFFGDFRATSQFADVDAIFIAGDLWDDTLELASPVWLRFILWFNEFMRWCARQNIAVRILEGTPRHDRRQSAAVEQLVEALQIDVDFKYIPSLSIEMFERLGLSVLYVPDECRPTAEAIRRDAEALLNEHRLEKVDTAIMHGMFKFQLGTIPMNPKVHEEQWWLEHVRYYLNIGHVHSMRTYERILGQGSFDRLAHGEEAPKGGMLIEEVAPGEWIHFFVENKGAKIYKTVDITGDTEVALKLIDREIRELPQGSYVRIRGHQSHPLFKGFDTLRTKYPLFTFSKKTLEEEDKVTECLEETTVDYVPIVLNRETITEAVFSEVSTRYELAPDQEKRLFHLLEELHE